jgi:tetratricopeptide (TPR) repeat protein
MLAAFATSAWSDVLTTLGGVRHEGSVSRSGTDWVVRLADGSTALIPRDQVRQIDFAAPASGDAKLDGALGSLRRSSSGQTEARRVVERYRQFLDQYAGTAIAAAAKLDLALWEDRVELGRLRLGPRWVTVDEIAIFRAAAAAKCADAMLALRESRLFDAEQIIAQALDDDPTSATALYLRGFVLYRQDKFQEARKSLADADAAAPNHGPTLNNLAVACFRINQFGPSLQAYDKAMIAMPLEPGLLNNIAEAFEALPPQQRESALAKRVNRKFDEQDTLLAQRMATRGLFRWGATWINQQQHDEIKAAEKANKEEVDRLVLQVQELERRAIAIDSEIRNNETDMRSMERDSLRYDTSGRLVQFPLPAMYYSLRSRNELLRGERQGQQLQYDRLQTQIKELEKRSPIPKFTGIQQLFAAEAAPLPPQATTQPAR